MPHKTFAEMGRVLVEETWGRDVVDLRTHLKSLDVDERIMYVLAAILKELISVRASEVVERLAHLETMVPRMGGDVLVKDAIAVYGRERLTIRAELAIRRSGIKYVSGLKMSRFVGLRNVGQVTLAKIAEFIEYFENRIPHDGRSV